MHLKSLLFLISLKQMAIWVELQSISFIFEPLRAASLPNWLGFVSLTVSIFSLPNPSHTVFRAGLLCPFFFNQNWKRLFQVPFSIPFRDKKIKRISKQRSKIAVRHREWRATWAFPRDNKSDKEIVVALRKDYLLSGSPEFFNTIACSTVFSWFWINFIITERLKRYMFTRISHERKRVFPEDACLTES